MKNAVSYLALIGSVAVAGWAAFGLVETATAPEYVLPQIGQTETSASVEVTSRTSPPFLAIYGTPSAPETRPTVAEPAVEPPAFVLKGLIAVGEVRWAVLSRDGVDVVVREGEVLEGGATVTRVRAEGIELGTEAGPMELGFNADAPVALTQIAAGPTPDGPSDPKGNFASGAPKAVLFQDMSSDEILAALEQAEERRIARGWVTNSE
ncbi:hypothetical protein SAMN05421759_107153 [Roseivivax lentus]|uniref:Uncharacterized protein n=1 Tax=Roseivivax lentus TaxID=633194 RepID=A0A1N7NB85_9RHOB|nr:hypothetical protein [Roseivivax lentus]SIS95518.1 hypothetical protein SAMN05421759_107153 [Roseivivax lentus]